MSARHKHQDDGVAVAMATAQDLELLTVSDVARILHVENKAVYRLVEERRIPFVRLGARKLRFSRTDLVAWIQGNRVPSLRRSA